MDPDENEEVPNGDNKDANSAYQTQEENDNKSHSRSKDEEDVSGKIFVQDLPRKTTSAEFVKHFCKYGQITNFEMMTDRSTGQSRGFGFVTYADPYVVDRVLRYTHIISGKQIQIKKYLPRGSNYFKNRIFVGGIPQTVTEDELKTFFMQFGKVKEQQIMLDRTNNRSRGFGFITFESEKAVDDLLVNGNMLELAGARVEIKKAEPKKPNQPSDSAYGANRAGANIDSIRSSSLQRALDMDSYENEAVPNGDNKDANSSSQTHAENEAVPNGDNKDANSSNQTQAENEAVPNRDNKDANSSSQTHAENEAVPNGDNKDANSSNQTQAENKAVPNRDNKDANSSSQTHAENEAVPNGDNKDANSSNQTQAENKAVPNRDNKDANSSSQTHAENEAVPNGDKKDANSSNQTQAENDSKSPSRSRDNEDVSGKIFVGGLARETTSAEFVKHFSKYGEITDSVILIDPSTGQSRGFGFVIHADPNVVDRVLQDTHIISGKQVGIEKPNPRGSNKFKNRIFVGGIPATVTEDEFKTFFMQFGKVKDPQIIFHRITGRPCGYGFITFESEKSVNDLLVNGNTLELAGAQVVIKKANPKTPTKPPDSAYGPYGGYYGGEFSGYGGYGGSGSGMGHYRGEPPLAYSSGYGTGIYGVYYMGGGYGGPGDFYSAGYGGSAGPGGAGAGYGSGYHMGPGGSYSGSGGSSMYGSRGGYGSSGSGAGRGAGASGSRNHVYQR